MTRSSIPIIVPHFGNGTDLSTDAHKISSKGNVHAMNMVYDKNGSCKTGLHARLIPEINWGEGQKKVQGSYCCPLFPDIYIVVINGKIKYTNLSNPSYPVYNFDTNCTLDSNARVKFINYRGQIYFCNGVNNMGRLSVAYLKTALTTGSTTVELEDEQGYRFNNIAAPVNSGRNTVFIEGDEINYTGVSGSGAGDNLTGASAIATSHAVGTIVTQWNTVTPITKVVRDMAIFKDTLFVIDANSPGIVSYGKTISTVGDIVAGAIHDFTDNENYIIGDGGELSALHSTETRMYAASKNAIDYITIQINPITGYQEFSRPFSFTKNYGILSPFCATKFEDVDVVLTGSRLIRFGYGPQNDQIIPSKDFDNEILPLLQESSKTGNVEFVFYNAAQKYLFIGIQINGGLRIILKDENTGAYAFPITLDIQTMVSYKDAIYYCDSIGRTYVIDGGFIAEGGSENHEFISAKIDDKSRDDKLFIKGRLEGKMKKDSRLFFQKYVDGNPVGGVLPLNASTVKIIQENISVNNGVGSGGVGDMVVGGDLSGSINIVQYEYHFLVGKRGKDIQIKISSNESGDFWSIDNLSVNYVRTKVNNSIYH